jgi:inositol polyphosphate-4-phosphatase
MRMWLKHKQSSDPSPGHGDRFADAIGLMSKLENVHRRATDKDVELLSLCQQLSRTMQAGRLTCCKSGKDRTSMSVTLETTALLSRDAESAGVNPVKVLSVLRSCGVRRQNLIKNIGKPYYAFNQIQWMNLPKMYRPPAGCYGSGQS